MSLNGIAKGTELESLMKNMMQAEANGTMMYYALAQLAREQGLDDVAEGFITAANEEAVHAGFDEAADQMEIFARQEGGHGVRLQAMLDKYQPKAPDTAGQKVYVCPVCGYEHVGDINDEDDSYVCPLCGQPKSAFVLKK